MGKKTQVEIAYEKLRMMIITEQLNGGYPVSEQQFAEQFKMSRTPIRAAFQKLSNDGLLDIIPHRGTFIKKLSTSEILHNYEIAEALEGMIVYLATSSMTERSLKELRHYMEEMDSALENESIETWIANDEEFHNLIYSHCENKMLVNQRKQIQGQIFQSRLLRSVAWSDKRASNSEHKQIFLAIKAGDPELARIAVQKHWARVREDLRRMML